MFRNRSSGAAAGEVQNDIDIGLVVHTINQLTLTLREYVEKKYDAILEELVRNPRLEPPFTKEQLEGDVDAVIEIIRRGIGFRKAH